MAKYPLTDSVSSQLNIYNIINESYYDQIHPSHVVPGAGRPAMLTLAVNY